MPDLDPRDKDAIYGCISEAIHMESQGVIRAICIGIVKEDGHVRTLTAIAEGGYRLAGIATAAILQREMMGYLEVTPDPDNYVATSKES